VALKDLCQPHIVLFGGALGASGGLGGGEGKGAWEARAAFGRRARETFGLVGFRNPVEPDLESAAFLEGLLDPFVRQPLELDFWPLLTGGFGQCLRIGVSPDVAVRPGQPSAILAHLLLGEVPAYEFPAMPSSAGPAESGGGPDDPFSRDDGWAKGKNLSRQDIFLKNTYEVLSHTARHRLREELWYHQALTPDGTVRECFFGPDLRIVVNFGTQNYEDKEDAFVIPPAGFVVRHPFVYAFHALRVNDVEYERPAFFVVRSLEGKMYLRAEQVNIYHGFGPDHIQLGGKTFRVEREAIVKIW
jgi:hypothetical protein